MTTSRTWKRTRRFRKFPASALCTLPLRPPLLLTAMGPDHEETTHWEKVLWKRQVYPDNYVPPKLFLASLQKNRKWLVLTNIFSKKNSSIANFRPYTYWPLVILSCSITQHLATIFIFLSIFVRLKENILDPRSLVLITVLLFFIGYATWNVFAVSAIQNNHVNANGGSDSLTNRALPVNPNFKGSFHFTYLESH